MHLQRYSGNPILSPNPQHEWESLVTTNPGAWFDLESQRVYLFHRVTGFDEEHRVTLGLANSSDGHYFEHQSQQPVFKPGLDGFDAGCIEDPRITKMGEYTFISYACRAFPPGQYWRDDVPMDKQISDLPTELARSMRDNTTTTGLAITKDFHRFFCAALLPELA